MFAKKHTKNKYFINIDDFEKNITDDVIPIYDTIKKKIAPPLLKMNFNIMHLPIIVYDDEHYNLENEKKLLIQLYDFNIDDFNAKYFYFVFKIDSKTKTIMINHNIFVRCSFLVIHEKETVLKLFSTFFKSQLEWYGINGFPLVVHFEKGDYYVIEKSILKENDFYPNMRIEIFAKTFFPIDEFQYFVDLANKIRVTFNCVIDCEYASNGSDMSIVIFHFFDNLNNIAHFIETNFISEHIESFSLSLNTDVDKSNALLEIISS